MKMDFLEQLDEIIEIAKEITNQARIDIAKETAEIAERNENGK
tara:strand:- start:874 stop:1002 length:129 start_codon:yes stop_codon:yes gene_type:complete